MVWVNFLWVELWVKILIFVKFFLKCMYCFFWLLIFVCDIIGRVCFLELFSIWVNGNSDDLCVFYRLEF